MRTKLKGDAGGHYIKDLPYMKYITAFCATKNCEDTVYACALSTIDAYFDCEQVIPSHH